MVKSKFNTIVVKIGSSSLTTPTGEFDSKNLKKIAAEIAGLIEQKKKVIVVTSGAIVCGSQKLKLGKPKTIPQKQAAAAVGQLYLMGQYEKAFQGFDLTIAQVLLTRDAIADRERYLNSRNTLLTLLAENIVPIVNENDTVAVEEIKIGDNDNLAALTASLVGADLLVLLTDVDGFYMDNEEGVSYLVPEITKITEEVIAAAGHPSTQLGTGGMITKIQAAKTCSAAGVHMAIINARTTGLINKLATGEKVGTIFYPEGSKQESRKRWLAHGLPIEGTLIVDQGAQAALREKGTSLLPIGIKAIKGTFKAGALVSIRTETEQEIARGLVTVDHQELSELLGKKSVGEAVHRDNLVVL